MEARGFNDKSLGNRPRGPFDSKSSGAESESSLQSARTARGVLVSRDRNAQPAAHCVKKLLLTLLVCLFLRHRGCARLQKKFQRSREHHERFAQLCRTGHCAQPSIYQLATAVDPATAAGGAAAAAAGAGGPGAAGAAAAAEKKSKDHCTG